MKPSRRLKEESFIRDYWEEKNPNLEDLVNYNVESTEDFLEYFTSNIDEAPKYLDGRVTHIIAGEKAFNIIQEETLEFREAGINTVFGIEFFTLNTLPDDVYLMVYCIGKDKEFSLLMPYPEKIVTSEDLIL